MNLSKKNLFTLFIVISGNFPLHAQVRPKISGATITVEFTDPLLAKRPLTLQTVKDNVFSYIGGEEHTKYADQDGCYRFRLKDVSNAIPVKIAVKCKESPVFGLIENYIEPGDSIHIRFTGKSVLGSKSEDIEFTGIGTAKFIVKNKLKNLTVNNLVRPARSIPVDTKYLDTLSGMADSTYIFFKRILDSYKDDIHKNIFQILDAEIYGKAHGSIFNHLAEFYNLHPGLAPAFKDSILSYLPRLQKKTYKDYSPMSLQASGYLNYLKSKARGTAHLLHEQAKTEHIYQQLVKQNTGYAREKILVYFLLSSTSLQNQGDLLKDALQYITNPSYIQLLTTRADKLNIGAELYPFILPDSSGKMISLNDFKGKLIILDFWFTGCGACSYLAKTIDQEVLPKYINNDEIVFISVCTDVSKQSWIRSIKSGKYTNEKSINLFTDGLALNHPFIKTYLFQGFPQLMLIDRNGKILLPSLPRKGKEMIIAIDQALIQK